MAAMRLGCAGFVQPVSSPRRARSTAAFEAEVIPGLESIANDELREKHGARAFGIAKTRAGFLRFGFSGPPASLNALRSVIAVYQIHRFDAPRPKALLSHQNFTRLVNLLAEAASSSGRAPRTFGIGAAGAGSSVMRRLRAELAAALGLAQAEDGKGELFVRFAPGGAPKTWEALARTTARPLSKRAYRLVNVPGSLNATVAYAMTRIQPCDDGATVVNLCSGTSTILIEHGLAQPRCRLLAIDRNASMLAAGERNAAASRMENRPLHLLADAGRAPLPPSTADRLYADLPFGHLSGTRELNRRLYPALLDEAARLARPGALFIALTHEIRLMRRSLRGRRWTLVSENKINLRGLHPRLFVLARNSARIEDSFGDKG